MTYELPRHICAPRSWVRPTWDGAEGSGGAAGSHRAGHSALLLCPIPEPDDGGGRLGVEGSACEIVGGASLQQNHRAAIDPGVLWGDCGVIRAISQGATKSLTLPASLPLHICSVDGRCCLNLQSVHLLPPAQPPTPAGSFPARLVDEGYSSANWGRARLSRTGVQLTLRGPHGGGGSPWASPVSRSITATSRTGSLPPVPRQTHPSLLAGYFLPRS